jgi:O-antigen/teichoic acid export membrane protein
MGLAFTGVFSIATYITAMIDIPYRSLNAISQPHISQSVKDNDIVEVNKISKNVSLHQLLAGSFIFLVIWINVDIIFKILPNGDRYVAGKSVILILGMLGLLNSSVNVGTTVLAYSRYYYYSLIFTFLITVLAISLNNYLIPIWGMNGAAMASLIASVINYTLLLCLNWWKMKTSPFSYGQLKIGVIIILLFSINWLISIFLFPLICKIPTSEIICSIIDSVIRTVIIIVAGITAVYYWKVSVEVNGLIRKYSCKLFKVKYKF